ILTERDLARAVAAGAAPGETPVTAWMSPEPVTSTPESEIPAALERMLDRNVRHLPVCADGGLVGTVSLRQLVRAASLRRVDPGAPAAAKGRENVTVAETRLSHIDATGGRLVYAGHDAVRLAKTRSFEDVWCLLLTGELPADGAFGARVAALRTPPLPAETLRALAGTAGSMMSKLESALAATRASRGRAGGPGAGHGRPALVGARPRLDRGRAGPARQRDADARRGALAPRPRSR